MIKEKLEIWIAMKNLTFCYIFSRSTKEVFNLQAAWHSTKYITDYGLWLDFPYCNLTIPLLEGITYPPPGHP